MGRARAWAPGGGRPDALHGDSPETVQMGTCGLGITLSIRLSTIQPLFIGSELNDWNTYTLLTLKNRVQEEREAGAHRRPW